MREKLYQDEFSHLVTVDFSDLAQGCKTYEEFIERMSGSSETDLQYLRLALCGPKKKVNKLTGNNAIAAITLLNSSILPAAGRTEEFFAVVR